MDPRAFERIALEELERVPPRFARRVRNVAILVEDEPSPEVCREEGLGEGETLLGLYRGIPAIDRGEGYSGVLPDTITLYCLPLLEEADALFAEKRASDLESAVRLAIRETLWHELGHHFGLSEDAVGAREVAGTNAFLHGTDRFEAETPYAQARIRRISGGPRGAIMKKALLAQRRLRRSARGRVSSLTAYMAKTLALIFGIIFVLVGLLGFVDNPLVGDGAVFEADLMHNIVHLALGAILLVVAFMAAAQSALWLKIIGIVYLVVALLGFVLAPESGILLGLVEVNAADHWLHVVLGLVLLGAGMYAKDGASAPSLPSSPPPPAPSSGQTF